jgi:D-3-phosphoglycerate dehydrogenase
VNTSRGPIVEEEALLTALRDNQIAGAALDVYDLEPLPADSPFLRLDNVLLSPHLGYSTETTLKNFFIETVKNLLAWQDGSPINVLNPEALG